MHKSLHLLLSLACFVACLFIPVGLSAQGLAETPLGQSVPGRAEVARLAAKLPGGGKVTLPHAARVRTVSALPSASRGTVTAAAAPKWRAQSTRPLAAAATGRTLWGNLLYSKAWGEGATAADHYGMYSFGAAPDPTFTAFKTADNIDASYGGAIVDGVFHCCYAIELFGYSMPYYAAYNIEDWTPVGNPYKMLDDYTLLSSVSAYDAASGRVYGNFLTAKGDGQEFGYADYDNFTHVKLGTANTDLIVMAAAPDGKLYGIDIAGKLYQVNKDNGATTLVGSTGVAAGTYVQSATADPKTGYIYWASVSPDQVSSLYLIDPATARATKVTDFPNNEQIAYLYAPEEVDPAAPAAPTDVRFSFEGAATQGSVFITLPAVTYGGDALTGTLRYTIQVGDLTLTGEGQPGATVERSLTLPAGEANFVIFVENEAGSSPKAKYARWIGADTPVAATGVSLAVDAARQATLTWQAPAEGVHGGYLNPAGLTYDIVRYPGAVTVAAGLTATTFAETLPQGAYDVYYYEVIAKNDTLGAAPAASNKVALGEALSVPYSETFDSTGFDKYTVIDANEDGVTWRSASGKAAYAYSDDLDADDWLITPPIRLEGGKVYELTYALAGGSYYTERYAVAYGLGSDPATYAEIQPAVDIAPAAAASHPAHNVSVTETGDYRFAFHALSPAGAIGISLDDITVSLAAVVTAPDSVTALKATAAPEGALQATVTFDAPRLTVEGKALADIDRIELSRGDEVLHTFSGPAPGASLSFTDPAAAQGVNTYALRAYNADGVGLKATVSVYVGLDTPGACDNIVLTDNADGTAVLTWDAPGTVGSNGGYVSPEGLTYTVCSISDYGYLIPIMTGLTERSYTVTGVPATGIQSMLRYAVNAVNAQGDGQSSISSAIIQGASDPLPYTESFAAGKVNTYWSVGGSGSGRFAVTTNKSADDDGGSVAYVPEADNELATFSSGKVALAGSQHPKLTLSYYAVPGSDSRLMINLLPVGNSAKAEELADIDYKTLSGEEGWTTLTYDLTGHKDLSYIRLTFVGAGSLTSAPVRIDAIRIYDDLAHNLAVTTPAAASAVKAGGTLPVSVKVDNQGTEPASGYTVDLLVNGQVVATKAGQDLAAGQSAATDFTYAVPITYTDSTLSLAARVNYAADLNPGNNTSGTLAIPVKQPTYPLVSDLTAEATDEGIKLGWAAPDVRQGAVTEGFEDYDAFTTDDFGEWTVYDLDGNKLYVFDGVSFPNQGGPAAYYAFNPSEVSGLDTEGGAPYSGRQYLASFASSYGASNDWIVSPLLTGKAQTVSLMARSWTTEYGSDTFEILASTTDADPAHFTTVASHKVSTTQWTEYTADLPEGTRYFAVRATSDNTFMLMIDDIKYDKADYQLTGYRIYRDGTLIGEAPATATAYTDATAAADVRYTYRVTALYSIGESGLSDEVSAIITGIDRVDGAAAVRIESLAGALAVTAPAAQPLSIIGTDGVRLYHAASTGHRTVVRLTPGTYLVTVGATAYKAIVR